MSHVIKEGDRGFQRILDSQRRQKRQETGQDHSWRLPGLGGAEAGIWDPIATLANLPWWLRW